MLIACCCPALLPSLLENRSSFRTSFQSRCSHTLPLELPLTLPFSSPSPSAACLFHSSILLLPLCTASAASFRFSGCTVISRSSSHTPGCWRRSAPFCVYSCCTTLMCCCSVARHTLLPRHAGDASPTSFHAHAFHHESQLPHSQQLPISTASNVFQLTSSRSAHIISRRSAGRRRTRLAAPLHARNCPCSVG